MAAESASPKRAAPGYQCSTSRLYLRSYAAVVPGAPVESDAGLLLFPSIPEANPRNPLPPSPTKPLFITSALPLCACAINSSLTSILASAAAKEIAPPTCPAATIPEYVYELPCAYAMSISASLANHFTALDNHLLARRPSLPGRICARSHFPRRYRHRHPGQGWHRPGRRAKGHLEAAGAGYIRREALRPKRVRCLYLEIQSLYKNANIGAAT